MKKVLSIVLVVAMVLCLAACGSTSAPAAQAPAAPAAPAQTANASSSQASSSQAVEEDVHLLDKPITFKFAFAETETSIQGSYLINAFNEISEKTNGDLVFEFYPNNGLGSQNDCFEMMRSGSNVICSTGFANYASLVPEFNAACFPYLFEDLYELYAIYDSEWFETMKTKLLAFNVVPFAFGAAGYRQFIGNTEVRKSSDLNGKIVRIGFSKVGQTWMGVVGGSPMSSSWSDVYSLLQTKACDLSEANVDMLDSSSLYEVSDYMSMTNHWATIQSLSMNGIAWNSIPEEYQKIVVETLNDYFHQITDASIEAEAKIVDKLGQHLTVVDDVDIEDMKSCLPGMYEAYDIDYQVYNDLRNIIESAN